MWPGPNSNTLRRRRAARGAGAGRDAAAERRRPRLPRRLLCRPDRQRHRRRGQSVRLARRQARLGRRYRGQPARPGRRARPAPSRREAAGLRPHRRRSQACTTALAQVAAHARRSPDCVTAIVPQRSGRGDASARDVASCVAAIRKPSITACATLGRCSTRSRFPPLRRGRLDTLQVNVGYRCNQSCVHCHVNAGPNRTEEMTRRRGRHGARLPRSAGASRRSTSPAARPSSTRISAGW